MNEDEAKGNLEPRRWERAYGFVLNGVCLVGAFMIAWGFLKSVSGILRNPSQRMLLFHVLQWPLTALILVIFMFRFLSHSRNFVRALSRNPRLKFAYSFAAFFAVMMLFASVSDAFVIASGGGGARITAERLVFAFVFSFVMAILSISDKKAFG